MTATVTQSYIDGIRDERALFNQCKAQGDNMQETARAALANIIATKAGFTGEVGEYLNGARDFWRNQLKKMES
jgi:hypothetical protein